MVWHCISLAFVLPYFPIHLPVAGSVASMTQTFKREIPHSLLSSAPTFSVSRSNLKPEIFYIINPIVSKILITAHD